jgi:hypothetical protein
MLWAGVLDKFWLHSVFVLWTWVLIVAHEFILTCVLVFDMWQFFLTFQFKSTFSLGSCFDVCWFQLCWALISSHMTTSILMMKDQMLFLDIGKYCGNNCSMFSTFLPSDKMIKFVICCLPIKLGRQPTTMNWFIPQYQHYPSCLQSFVCLNKFPMWTTSCFQLQTSMGKTATGFIKKSHLLWAAGKSLSSKYGSHPPCYIRTGCKLSKYYIPKRLQRKLHKLLLDLTIVSVSAKPKQTCCNLHMCMQKVIIFVFDFIRTIPCKVKTIFSLLNLGTQPSHCRPDKTCKKTKWKCRSLQVCREISTATLSADDNNNECSHNL